jgi:transposase
MDLHANAALSWSGRRELARRVVDQGWTLRAAAEAGGVSVRCARKWVGRYRAGDRELRDRSSAPRRVANRTRVDRVVAIIVLRRLWMTAAEIAEILQMPLSTVSAVLKRNGIGRLGRIGVEPAIRYERSRPGELIHIDVKKLGRFQAAGKRVGFRLSQAGSPRRRDADGHDRGITGWEYVHVAVDDYSRLAYAEVLTDEKEDHGDRLSPTSARLLRQPRHPRRASTDRQRQRLHLDPARDLLPAARHPPPPDTTTPSADQRQSRAIHPHTPKRLGLRRHLPHQRRTRRRP